MGGFFKALWRNRQVREVVVIAAIQILAVVAGFNRDDKNGK